MTIPDAGGAARAQQAGLCLVPPPDASSAGPTGARGGARTGGAAPASAQAAAGGAAAARMAAGGAAAGRLQRAVRPKPKPAPPRPAPPSTPAPGYSPPAKAAGEWAFLDDRKLSVEDKLFRFMALAAKKSDEELVKKMKEYKARFTAEGKGSSAGASGAKPKGSSLFDVAKAVVQPLGLVEKVIGKAGVEKAASTLGGPLLAAAATAVGLPHLAPLALKYGGDLAKLAFQEVGGSSKGSTAAGGAEKAEAGSPDERIAMLELQRMVEKQQQMFTAISNAMRALHDTQMAAVHNIR